MWDDRAVRKPRLPSDSVSIVNMGTQHPAQNPQFRKVQLVAGSLSLIVAFVMVGGKLFTWRLTGSTAVLSDGLESVVNIVASAMLLYSIILAMKPVDRNHPYGHGKIEFLSAGFEGAMILVAAVVIVVQAIREMIKGPELEGLDTGVVILVGLTLLNAALAFFLVQTGRRTNSVALVADGRHVFADVWTTAGVIVGLVGVHWTGWQMLDPIMALAVGLHILRSGWSLVRQAVGGLMDEADEERLLQVTQALQTARRPGWIDAHRLRLFRAGSMLHADLHLIVPRYWDADKLHEVDREASEAIFSQAETAGDVIIHFDPCRPRHCSRCNLEDCAIRREPQTWPAHFERDRILRYDDTPPGSLAAAEP